jgi:hypothetical protein
MRRVLLIAVLLFSTATQAEDGRYTLTPSPNCLVENELRFDFARTEGEEVLNYVNFGHAF